MTEVISVKFKNTGKVYYFDPQGIKVSKGDNVVVETSKGLEFAECAAGNHEVADSAVHQPLRPVVRVATKEDELRAEENRRREEEAFEVCRQKIAEHGLDMKLVDVEYNFEGNKILFFFTSEGRVDFRELVKDLASVFKTRIELRQIGVRDEARLLGGLGICGRPFCCAQFLDDFQPVSIKMAKTQGLSLNPTKISGTCGRLMCCLKYEQEAYEELVHNVPKIDAFVDTPSGKGSVVDVNLLKGTVRVRLEDQADNPMRTFESSEVTVLGGKAKRAEYLALKAEGKVEEPRRQQPRLKRSVETQTQQQPPVTHSAEAAEGDDHRRQKRAKQRPDVKRQKLEQPSSNEREGSAAAPRQEAAQGTAPQDRERRQNNNRRRYRPRGGKRPGDGSQSNSGS